MSDRERQRYEAHSYIKEFVIRYTNGEVVMPINNEVSVKVEVSYDWSHLRNWPGRGKRDRFDVPPLELCRKLVRMTLEGEWDAVASTAALSAPQLPGRT